MCVHDGFFLDQFIFNERKRLSKRIKKISFSKKIGFITFTILSAWCLFGQYPFDQTNPVTHKFNSGVHNFLNGYFALTALR